MDKIRPDESGKKERNTKSTGAQCRKTDHAFGPWTRLNRERYFEPAKKTCSKTKKKGL